MKPQRRQSLSCRTWLWPAVALCLGTAPLPAQDPAPYAGLWQEIDLGWKAQKQSFNERLADLQQAGLAPDELQQKTDALLKEHMTTARKYAGKLNRIYNEACRLSGVKPSVGGDPASRMGRGLAGGDVDFSGSPQQVQRFVKALGELGVPESELKLIERTPSRVTVEGVMNFTVNYTPPQSAVGSQQHRQTILEGATDIEHDLSVAMDKNQPGRKLVAVEGNLKKAQKGLYDSPAELLETPEHLQPAVKGTLKNINVAELSEADLKVLLRRNGISTPVDEVTDMLQRIKSQGGNLAPRELFGLDAAKTAQLQQFLRDVNATAEWKTLQEFKRQARIAADIARELAASNDPLVRNQLQELRETWIDSRLRMEASVQVNQAREMELLHAARNAKAHRVEELSRQGPSPELDRALAELKEIQGRLAQRGRQQAALRRLMESQLKTVCTPAEPNQGVRRGTEDVVNAKTGLFATEVRPSIRAAGKAAGIALAGLAGMDEYQQNRQAGHGVVYAAAGGALKTGVMLHPLSVVYFAPETSWNSAKATASAYVRDELERLAAEGRPLTKAEAERIAFTARVRGTAVGTVFGSAMVSQVAAVLFPASTTAAFAGPVGLVVLSGGFAWSQFEPIRRDRKLVNWNQSRQLEQVDAALRFGRAAYAELLLLSSDIERQIAALQALIGTAENGERSYDFYRQQHIRYVDYSDRVARRVESLRTALAQGTLRPSADGRLYAEFDAVKADSDAISAEVDDLLARFKAGSLPAEGVRARHFALVAQFGDIQKRYVAARRTFDDLKLLAQLPAAIEGYQLARQRAELNLFQAQNRAEQLAALGDGVPARVAALTQAAEAFATRRATALRGLEYFLLRGGRRDEAQDRELQAIVDSLRGLKLPRFQASDFQVAGSDLRHTAGMLRLLSETKLPAAVNFDGLDQYRAAASQAVLDLGPIAAEALAALERARKQLARLAGLIESLPPPPPPIDRRTPEPQPPTSRPPISRPPVAVGGARIQEVARNVFAVEMDGLPAGACFVWVFGDGSPRAQTTTPRVQHNYTAPTGGVSGLAGKRWPLSVTVYDAGGRAVATATTTVSRSRLTDAPIQKRAPPPSMTPFYIPKR
jgi:hypothetical protein